MPEDHEIAGPDEALRYIQGTCYDANADYILFAREVAKHFAINKSRIVEFGCGPGRLAYELAKMGCAEIVGLDGCRHMVESAMRRFNGHNLSFACIDLFHAPSHLNDMDVIVSQNALHHFCGDRLSGFFQAGLDVLKPGGHMYIADYRRDAHPEIVARRLLKTHEAVADDLQHTLRAAYTKDELTECLDGFRDRIIFEVFFPDEEYEYLQSHSDFDEIIARDQHPHHLDFLISLRIKIRKLR